LFVVGETTITYKEITVSQHSSSNVHELKAAASGGGPDETHV